MRYVLSDTHFGHGNIIEYCDRPFDDVGEMDRVMLHRWNETVGRDDTVLFLGDVQHHPCPWSSAHWNNILNGEVMLVRGNHDGDVGQNAPFNTVESCTISQGRYQFYCEHQPVDFGGWQIHGHTHNNNLYDYPFINHDNKTVNVSVEVLDYKPLEMETLRRLLAYDSTFKDIYDAEEQTGIDLGL